MAEYGGNDRSRGSREGGSPHGRGGERASSRSAHNSPRSGGTPRKDWRTEDGERRAPREGGYRGGQSSSGHNRNDQNKNGQSREAQSRDGSGEQRPGNGQPAREGSRADRPWADRNSADRNRSDSPRSAKPRFDRSGTDRPRSERTRSDQPRSDRFGAAQRSDRTSGGERRAPWKDRQDRPERFERPDRPGYSARPERSDRPERFERSDRSTSGSRPERKFPQDRDSNGYRRFNSGGPSRSAEGGERGERRERSDAPAKVHNPRDLRSANRPDRERSPDIEEGVTGAELDKVTRAQLRTLETRNGEWVAKHLVMAGRLIDEDPELAFQHALAASRRGGRLAAVREAVGLTAYAAGHYGEALREFRTFRRISGSNVHLPLMADSERGLGRPDRALDMARGEEAADLDAAGQVELAMVVSGARADLGQQDAALAALEIPQLDKNRAFSYSPRLFRAYADALEAVGRAEEAASWRRQAALADQALTGDEDPEIIDLGDEDDEDQQPSD